MFQTCLLERSIYQFINFSIPFLEGAREMETESVEDRSITYNPVPLNNGHTEFTRIWCSPYSAASPLVALVTAALLALYHTNPGRGLVAPIEAMLINEPPVPWARNCGIIACEEWKMDLTFTVKTLSKSSSVTSRDGYVARSSASLDAIRRD